MVLGRRRGSVLRGSFVVCAASGFLSLHSLSRGKQLSRERALQSAVGGSTAQQADALQSVLLAENHSDVPLFTL